MATSPIFKTASYQPKPNLGRRPFGNRQTVMTKSQINQVEVIKRDLDLMAQATTQAAFDLRVNQFKADMAAFRHSLSR